MCEAYFGQLLHGVKSAIAVYDQFAMSGVPGHYAIVMEFARFGDLVHYFKAAERPWSETKIRREMSCVLEVLDVLHRGAALHRDLTPFNVLVCGGRHLKLGDFGIAKHHRSPKGVPARTMAPWMAPPEVYEGKVQNWQARDDVYQVGQLLGMLVNWNGERIIGANHLRLLDCSNEMKEIVRRCIGTRAKRFETAGELIRHLVRTRRRFREGRVPTLKGQVVVFTGSLRIPRARATTLARRAGARVVTRVSGSTTVVVAGACNRHMVAGDRGQKLIDVAMLLERGYRVKVIYEAQFLRLVG